MRGGEAKKLPTALRVLRGNWVDSEPEPGAHGGAQRPPDARGSGLQREDPLTAGSLEVYCVQGGEALSHAGFSRCGGSSALGGRRLRVGRCGVRVRCG